jgi:hypothetical protein
VINEWKNIYMSVNLKSGCSLLVNVFLENIHDATPHADISLQQA